MADPTASPPANAAQVRGDIDRGLAGDKVRGFDPATAPMETDAEAAGTPLAGAEMEQARAAPAPAPGNVNATSHGTAMRPMGQDGEGKSARKGLPALAVAIVAAILVLAGAVLILS